MSAKQTKGCPFPEEKLAFAKQKTEGYIFLTFISYLPSLDKRSYHFFLPSLKGRVASAG